MRDTESIAKAVEYSNVVINLIGRDYETRLVRSYQSNHLLIYLFNYFSFTLYTFYRNFKFHDVHVEGAKVIAEASRKAGVKRLVHFSALGANPDSPSKFLKSKVLILSFDVTL